MFTLPTITNVYATSAEVSWCETHLSLGVVKQAFTPHLSESAKHFLSVSLWSRSVTSPTSLTNKQTVSEIKSKLILGAT